jgi:hypothetical protein
MGLHVAILLNLIIIWYLFNNTRSLIDVTGILRAAGNEFVMTRRKRTLHKLERI